MKYSSILILALFWIVACTNNIDIDEFMDNTLVAGMPVPDRDPLKLFLDQHADHKEHEFPRPDKPNWYTCTHYSSNPTQIFIVIATSTESSPVALVAAREYFPGLMDRYEFQTNIDKAIAATHEAAGKSADAKESGDNSQSTKFIWYLGDDYVYSMQPYPETRNIQYMLMHQ